MHMLSGEAVAFLETFLPKIRSLQPAADVAIAPPFTTLQTVSEKLSSNSHVKCAAQNMHWFDSGAHTGEVSPKMLREFQVDYVILGHSERRLFYGETDSGVSKRALAAVNNNITPIVCIGETKEQFEAGKTLEVIRNQLLRSLHGFTTEQASKIVIAYEPVWAIGTGLAATPEQASTVHDFIRSELAAAFSSSTASSIRLLYGGSTTPDNIASLMQLPNVNGALIGGASLKPETFIALIQNGSANPA